MGGHEMTADEVKKHVKTYYLIFGALLFLTVVTVGVSYLHLPIAGAVILALIVATIKGSLVCLFFMHLSNEKRIIYWTLLVTAVMFFFCMLIPGFNHFQQVHTAGTPTEAVHHVP
jgi:cytochrome c oxidase subunit IV